jgi:hypothetical protein
VCAYYIILCGPSGSTMFFKRSNKWHGFRKKLLNAKLSFYFLYNLVSETFLILKIIQRDIIIDVHTSSCKLQDVLVIF